MKLLLLAVAFALAVVGCKSNSQNMGGPGNSGSTEPDRSKAYYLEGANDRHNSRAGHMMHY
jgi:hypothetical protein